MSRLRVTLALLALAGRAAAWEPVTPPMTDGRWAPAYTLLPGGTRALIAGGYSYARGQCVATADVFDERTRRLHPCRTTLTQARDFATATPLPAPYYGVLIAGGFDTELGSLDSAELYDPATETFQLLSARLTAPRELFAATALADGRILLTGGFNTHRGRTQDSAELYDPKTRTFTPTATPMHDERFGQAAVRLADGRVLIAGGKRWHVGQPDHFLASAEIFDPATGAFHSAHGPMAVPRDRPTATLLPDGRVLIAGGQNGADGPRLAELFDPRTETFSPLTAQIQTPRMAHAAVTLPDGRVLLAGGWGPSARTTTDSVEIYDPAARTFAPVTPLPFSAHDLALVAFPDALVLAAGGKDAGPGRETSVAAAAWAIVPPRIPASP